MLEGTNFGIDHLLHNMLVIFWILFVVNLIRINMKRLIFGLVFMSINANFSFAQNSNVEQEIMDISKTKWQWMADKNVEKLAILFDDKSKFVHMSGTWNKGKEIEIIKTGSIWYKKADVHDVVIEIFDDTAILWNRITLLAVVRGNEVSNPFTVTEVYKERENGWQLLAMTFSSVRSGHSIEP